MPLYRYIVVESGGKQAEHWIEAHTLEEAKEKVRKQGVWILTMAPGEKREQQLRLRREDLVSFTKEMAQLLRAGLPVHQALQVLLEKQRKGRTGRLLSRLGGLLEQGHTFSSALGAFPHLFDPVYRAVVRAGEESGSLVPAMQHLAALTTQRELLRKQCLTALTYPALLFAFAIAILLLLLFVVVPSLQELFEGRSLHPITAFVVALSRGVRGHLVLTGFAAACTLGLITALCTVATWRRRAWDYLARLPLLRSLIVDAAWARSCRVLSLLLHGGIPLAETLTLTRGVAGSSAVEQVLRIAEEQLLQGGHFSTALVQQSAPLLLVRMVATAEETGQMADALGHVAEVMQEEWESQLKAALAWLQPFLLLLLAFIVGGVLLALLIPLTDVSSFLDG